MAALARLVALAVSTLLPAATLAQQAAGGDPAAHLGGWLWVWALAAAALLVALAVTMFRRDPTQPGR